MSIVCTLMQVATLSVIHAYCFFSCLVAMSVVGPLEKKKWDSLTSCAMFRQNHGMVVRG